LSLCVAETGDPFGRGREGDALAGEAGADAERDREVGLAGAGRVGVALLTLLIRCRSACEDVPFVVELRDGGPGVTVRR